MCSPGSVGPITKFASVSLALALNHAALARFNSEEALDECKACVSAMGVGRTYGGGYGEKIHRVY